MRFSLRQPAQFFLYSVLALACILTHAQQPAPPPQVIQTAALGVPSEILTQDDQWSTLISILSNPDLNLYVEDVSNDAWLARNADNFVYRGQYTIDLISFYKTRRPCRDDQIHAGFSDSASVDACNNYRYRIRRIAVDTQQNTLTQVYSAMVLSNGALDPSSVLLETRTRGSAGLDADALKALDDTTKLVSKQAHMYYARQRNIP